MAGIFGKLKAPKPATFDAARSEDDELAAMFGAEAAGDEMGAEAAKDLETMLLADASIEQLQEMLAKKQAEGDGSDEGNLDEDDDEETSDDFDDIDGM